MRRLAWTFAARIGDKYQIRLTRSILLPTIKSWFLPISVQVISTGYVQPPGGSGAVYPPNGGYGAPGVQATPGQPPAYGPTSSAAFPPPAPAYSGEKAQ